MRLETLRNAIYGGAHGERAEVRDGRDRLLHCGIVDPGCRAARHRDNEREPAAHSKVVLLGICGSDGAFAAVASSRRAERSLSAAVNAEQDTHLGGPDYAYTNTAHCKAQNNLKKPEIYRARKNNQQRYALHRDCDLKDGNQGIVD